MPSSSAALKGEFNPTPFQTHKTRSGQFLESTQEAFSPRQIETDLSAVDDVDDNTDENRKIGGFLSSTICKIVTGALIVGLIAAAFVLPVAMVLLVVNAVQTTTDTTVTTTSATTVTTTSATTTTTTSTSTTTTTTAMSDGPSLWTFDNTLSDSITGYNGISVNSTSYLSIGVNGYSGALSINRATGQYISIPTFRSLAYRSFTVELWIYCISLTAADYGLFGQFEFANQSHSLHYQIRNFYLHLAFFSDDLTGTTIIQNNNWYHVAFVYDNSTSIQQIYLNGKLDASRTSTAPYKGLSGSISIGTTQQVFGSYNPFSGYIDEVSLVMRAKNATEILNDATLITWQSFDGGSYTDSGSLRLQVTAASLTSVTGRVNQAIEFTSSSSYYQMRGFVHIGIINYPYSIALWVRPSLTNGSILVHLSTTTNGNGWCAALMGLSSTGQIIAAGWSGPPQQVIGPILPANVWTHVVNTFSLANGQRLYVNGTYIGTTGPMQYLASSQINLLTLGNPLQAVQVSAGGTCNSLSIVPSSYRGAIDEFRVYSRELNSTDIYSLANP